MTGKGAADWKAAKYNGSIAPILRQGRQALILSVESHILYDGGDAAVHRCDLQNNKLPQRRPVGDASHAYLLSWKLAMKANRSTANRSKLSQTDELETDQRSGQRKTSDRAFYEQADGSAQTRKLSEKGVDRLRRARGDARTRKNPDRRKGYTQKAWSASQGLFAHRRIDDGRMARSSSP